MLDPGDVKDWDAAAKAVIGWNELTPSERLHIGKTIKGYFWWLRDLQRLLRERRQGRGHASVA